MSSVSKNSKTQKKSASRLSQRKHQERGSEQKFLQRKVFTKSSRPPTTNQYKVVHVPCKIPSAFIVPKKDTKKETKKEIKNDWEIKLQKFRERQQQIKEKYSPKMRELYVNPKKLKKDSINEFHGARVPEIVAEPITTNDGGDDKSEPKNCVLEQVYIRQSPMKLEENAKSLITQVTFEQKVPQLPPEVKAKANQLITEAHRMIWYWLFHGLFPPTIAAKHK